MLVSDFHFDLPDDLIAQQPPAVRGSSRMLQLNRATGNYADRQFINLPQILQSGDLLVLNDSRVLPARLFATRAGLTTQHNSPSPSGQVEVLLTQACVSHEGHNDWNALVRPAKKVQPSETLLFAAAETPGAAVLRATVLTAGEFGERTLRFEPVADFYAALERIGYLPLPPYIHRPKSEPNTPEDRERYQTVYSRQSGSAAAPTAGLHFTPEIFAALENRGVEIARITLHVGLGTFQPVRVNRTENIRLHAEPYTLSEAAASAINGAKQEGRRIVAVGSTSLFLSPGVEFKLVSGLLTNFHLPQSTLLMLVSAFAGREAVQRAYAHAVAERYRFFSYGDCMLIL